MDRIITRLGLADDEPTVLLDTEFYHDHGWDDDRSWLSRHWKRQRTSGLLVLRWLTVRLVSHCPTC
ncbi:MAG: hypothetical protein ACRDQ4_14880 [Pseudonocardiaceae bacterium]